MVVLARFPAKWGPLVLSAATQAWGQAPGCPPPSTVLPLTAATAAVQPPSRKSMAPGASLGPRMTGVRQPGGFPRSARSVPSQPRGSPPQGWGPGRGPQPTQPAPAHLSSPEAAWGAARCTQDRAASRSSHLGSSPSPETPLPAEVTSLLWASEPFLSREETQPPQRLSGCGYRGPAPEGSPSGHSQ